MELSKRYVDGFNSGYTIRQHSSELAKKLIDTLKEQGEYIQGLRDGKLQFEQELDKEIQRFADQHKKNIQKLPTPEKGKDADKDQGYDNL